MGPIEFINAVMYTGKGGNCRDAPWLRIATHIPARGPLGLMLRVVESARRVEVDWKDAQARETLATHDAGLEGHSPLTARIA